MMPFGPGGICAPPPAKLVLRDRDTRVHEARRVVGTVVIALLLEELGDDALRAPKLLFANLPEAEQLATSVSVDPDLDEDLGPVLGVVLEGLPRPTIIATLARPPEEARRWSRWRARASGIPR